MQLELFNTESAKPQNSKHKGATSQNKELFYDYEAFCDKFKKKHVKTTDDCYTPEDVFQAVLKYVGTLTDLRGKRIVRPFYPDGDYTKEEYRENDVVVDNPPFSILAQIVRFYQARNVQYFLFCNGLTALHLCKYGACIVVINGGIKFENGADINISFATNLITDCYAVTAPQLSKSIEECESQDSGGGMVKYEKPDNLICVSHLQSVAQRGVEIRIPKKQSRIVRKFGGTPLLGSGMIVCDEIAKRIKSIKSTKSTKSDNVRVLQPTHEDSNIIIAVNNMK